MFFSKSMTFGEETLGATSPTTYSNSAVLTAEQDFVEKLKSGDAEAFDDLVKRYTGNIYSLLVRLTEDEEEARDLTQETFLRALKSIGKFRGEADLKTWLYRIAVNESRNRFRWWKRRYKNFTFSLDAQSVNGERLVEEPIADPSYDPEKEVLRRERESALRAALADLSVNLREAIVLRDIEGLTYEEVAAALETNVGTVKSRIARGREELRKRLSGF